MQISTRNFSALFRMFRKYILNTLCLFWLHISSNDYLRYGNTNKICYAITVGKVSPWIILNSASGKEMLQGFRDDQLAAISNIIDPQVWVKKFKTQKFDLDLVRKIVKESSL